MKSHLWMGMIVASALLFAGAARAAEGPYLYGAQSFWDPDSKRHVKNDRPIQGTVGYTFNDFFNLELVSGFAKYRSKDDSTGYKISGGALQGVFNLSPNTPIAPLWLAGAGAQQTFWNGQQDTNWTVRTGVGVAWLSDDLPIGIRGEAVVQKEFHSKSGDVRRNPTDNIYSLGLLYRFGDIKKSVAQTYGITDRLEQRVQPVTASAKSTSTATKTVSSATNRHQSSLDLDGDGIPNQQDKCADSPSDAKVDEDGCIMYLRKV